MINDLQKREQLVKNRKEIADKAIKLADAFDKKFLIDAGFIGGLGTAITTIFAQYGGSTLGSTVLGTSSASLIALSHVMGTLNKELYTKMSEQAKDEVFSFENGDSLENKHPIRFQDYEETFNAQHEHKLSSLKTIRSAAIICGFSAMAAFAMTQNANDEFRKDDEIEDIINKDLCPNFVLEK